MITPYNRFSLILLLIFTALILGAFFYFWKDINSFYGEGHQTEKAFFIERGDKVYNIASKLEEKKFIKNKWSFLVYVFLTGNYGKLQAGEYLISSLLTIPEIVEKFVSGSVITKRITIIEGWNLRDVAAHLEERGIFLKDDFFKITNNDFSEEFEFLKDKPKNLSIEGYLFPDTYEIRRGEGLNSVIKKMLINFDKKLTPDLREEIGRQNKTIFEIITMASLLEKEVRTLEEKKIVSGILWKRLSVNMLLQIDATITFLTGKRTTKISLQELQIESPYNTYKYRGLPLGPICNPGIESIVAAIHPQKSEFWYYIAIPEKSVFSKTLKEHNLAKQKYLKTNDQ